MTVLDATGKPIMGNDGQPIRVGCDGKLVSAMAPQTTAPTTNGGAQGGQAAKPPSRYGGDVLLQGASEATALQTAQVSPNDSVNSANPPAALALMQQLMGGTQPARINTGMKNTSDGGGEGGRESDKESGQESGGFMHTASAQTSSSDTSTATTNGMPNQQGAVGPLLTPTVTPKVSAAKIGDRNMLLAKGAQIDCALTTRLISEVSGFASCLLTSNIYSDNGRVLLLERGSEAQGEYVATIAQGQRRLFVLWQRVKTPVGVVIALDSPAADGLGTMGLNGHVDNHWWDRLGAAFLLSFVKDGIAYEIAKSSGGANSNAVGAAYQNTTRTGEQMAERILGATINIKPTVYKNQSDRASIYQKLLFSKITI